VSRTLDRALELLEAVLTAPEPMGLMEAAETTGLDKSTALRMLTHLTERGSLSRDPATKRYAIGPRSFALAATVSAHSDLRAAAGPHLDDLQGRTGETVSLHLRVDRRRVCVDGRESAHPVRRVVPLGESLPLSAGPSGKVVLAHLSEDKIAAVLNAAGLRKADRDAVRADLERVRQQGYLHTQGDRTVGIRAVSAPIFGPSGVVGSVTVAGPSERWDGASAAETAPLITAAAHAISTNLGAST